MSEERQKELKAQHYHEEFEKMALDFNPTMGVIGVYAWKKGEKQAEILILDARCSKFVDGFGREIELKLKEKKEKIPINNNS